MWICHSKCWNAKITKRNWWVYSAACKVHCSTWHHCVSVGKWTDGWIKFCSVCSSFCSPSSLDLYVNGWWFSFHSGLTLISLKLILQADSHFTNYSLCCPPSSSCSPPSLQPQGRPHPQAPAQPIMGRHSQRRQVTLKEVQVLMALPPWGNKGHLTRSQSVWRWRVRGRDVCPESAGDCTAGPRTPHRTLLTRLTTNNK